MTAEELYTRIGGDYASALARLGSDAFVAKMIVMFARDESCAAVAESWKARDTIATFNAAHTAKGVCANLSLTKLADLASAVTEALRPGNEELLAATDVDALVAELERAHEDALSAISEFAG